MKGNKKLIAEILAFVMILSAVIPFDLFGAGSKAFASTAFVPNSTQLNSVCYSPDKDMYIAVGNNSSILTSADGINWVDRLPHSGLWNDSHIYTFKSVAWGKGGTGEFANGKFVVTGYDNSTTNHALLFTSDDGISWTKTWMDSTATATRINAVTWDSNTNSFICTGYGGASLAKSFVYSGGSTVSMNSVGRNGTGTAYEGRSIATAVTAPGAADNYRYLLVGKNVVAYGDTVSSLSGTNFASTSSTYASLNAIGINYLTYNASSNSQAVIYDSTSNSYIVAGKDGGYKSGTTTRSALPYVGILANDADSFVYKENSAWPQFEAIANDGTNYVFVGSSGKVYTTASSSVATWKDSASNMALTAAASPVFSTLYSVTAGNGMLVAVGASGTIIYSSNHGATWTATTSSNFSIGNNAPQITVTPDGAQTIEEGKLITLGMLAADGDNDTITYSVYNLPANANFDSSTGMFNWVPAFGQAGTYTIGFQASDPYITSKKDVTITVTPHSAVGDEAPVFGYIPVTSYNIDEMQTVSFSVYASDPNKGTTVTYSVYGAPAGSVFNTSSGNFSWTPQYHQAGTYSLIFGASDGVNTTKTSQVTITVNSVNTAPVLASPGNKIVNEGKTLSFSLSAADAQGDALTYTMTGAPAGAVLDQSTGQFNWAVPVGQSGFVYDNVKFIANDGLTASVPTTITIFVNNADGTPSVPKSSKEASGYNALQNEIQLAAQMLGASQSVNEAVYSPAKAIMINASVDVSAQNIFSAQIEAAKTVLNATYKTYSDYMTAANTLLSNGEDFIANAGTAAKLDYTVIDESENTVAYSVYRNTLAGLVWQAKSMLFIDPELYTDADRATLQERISSAESCLDGTYSVPYVRNRQFSKPRIDEDIQIAISHNTMLGNYGSKNWGLKDAISWYRGQNILADSYKSVTLYPTDDTWVNYSSSATNYGTNDTFQDTTALTDTYHTSFALMKFDLSAIAGNPILATFYLTNKKTDSQTLNLNYEANDSWSESTLTYGNASSTYGLPLISSDTSSPQHIQLGTTFATVGSGSQYGRASTDITDAVVKEFFGDKKLSFSIRETAHKYTNEMYTKEAAVQAYRPELVVLTDIVDLSSYKARYDSVINLAQSKLSEAAASGTGTGVGQYSQAAVDSLRAYKTVAEAAYETNDPRTIGTALVNIHNAVRDLRNSQVTRSQAEPGSTLYLPAGGIEQLRQKINENPELKAQYDYLKQQSDILSLEQIQAYNAYFAAKPDYQTLNQKYQVWNNTDNLSYTAPDGAAYFNMEFDLPSAENEQDGLGHCWVDKLVIIPSDSGNLVITNASFEDPDLTNDTKPNGWKAVVTGNGVAGYETTENYVRHYDGTTVNTFSSDGKRSLYLMNPTAGDSSSWVYEDYLKATAGTNYTVTFSQKIDGKLKSGIVMKLNWYDSGKNYISSSTATTNRTSSPSQMGFGTTAQADAIVYAVSGDITYAQKAKARMLWWLNDFTQGIEQWYQTGSRPDNIDAYGAVQGGRVACTLASTYSLIKDSGVFTRDELATLKARAKYLLDDLADSRDRSQLTNLLMSTITNWNTDMNFGTGELVMAFPELVSDPKVYLNNSVLVNGKYIEEKVGPDGEWPESIRYGLVVLERLGHFTKALNNDFGINWMKTTKVPKMFEYIMISQTPEYKYFNNEPATPNYGDHVLKDGTDLSVLGLMAEEVATADPALGAQLYDTWVRGGRHFNTYSGEAVAMENFFVNPDFKNTDNVQLNLTSTNKYNAYGLNIFRSNFLRPNESFMSIVSNVGTAMGHNHYDQGSFILFKDGVLLVADPGIESYFNSTKNWYIYSNSHSVVQFKKSDGTYANTPTTSNSLDEFTATYPIDAIKLTVAAGSDATGTQTRNIAYIKDGFEIYVIWDQIKNQTYGTRFNLPVTASKDSVIDGNKITSSTSYGIDLETTVLSPLTPVITQEWARSTDAQPWVNGYPQLNYIREYADAGQNFLNVLYPKATGTEGLTTSALTVDNSNIEAYKLLKSDGSWVIIAVNNSASAQTVNLPSTEALVDMKTPTKAVSYSNGTASVTLSANSLYVFKPASYAGAQPAFIEITGAESVSVPDSGSTSLNYRAAVIDQYNNKMNSPTISWSAGSLPSGVQFDSTKGILTVSSSVTPGAVAALTAASGDVTKSINVQIGTAPEKVATPTALPASGVYTEPQSVTLSSETADAVIYYTTDGTEPTTVSTLYTGVIAVSSTETIKAIAVKDGMTSSNISTFTYTIRTNSSGTGGSAVANNTDKATAVITVGKPAADSEGKVNVVIETKALENALANANADSAGEKVVTVQIPKVENAKKYSFTLPVDVMSNIDKSSAAKIILSTELGAITLPNNIVESSEIKKASTITISIEKTYISDNSALSKKIGNRPVFDINMEVDGKRVPWSNSNTPVSVSVPYIANEDELKNPEHITVWYIDEAGKENPVSNAKYDSAAGLITFRTAHFSQYAVVYVDKAFKDLEGYGWAKKQIEVLAAKGIINGTSADTFNPGDNVTRADFLHLLINTLELTANADNNFKDVSKEDYYYKSVGIAKALGITEGTGSSLFNPEENISRQDMMTLTAKALKIAKKLKGEAINPDLSRFTDSSEVSLYAINSVAALIQNELIEGDGKALNPTGNASRAEIAALMYRIYNK